ncbi:OST-HTH/LOTUS domain [Popillia japonica]|uniref:OST-HTH/LOTUS domain n=1 Tax=Popillia japonica TaxID=7064 RepID=A0AAW1MKJ9_POPJA
MEELRKEVYSNIRSCLLSTKEKCDLRQLRSDYKMLMGSDIPFKKLKFGSLEELLSSMDNLNIVKGPGNVVYISAKPTDKSSHLTELISKQKTSKKKRMPVRPHRRPVVYNNSPGNNRWRPTNVNNKWKTAYQHPPRLAAVSHNQIVRVNPHPTITRSTSNNSTNTNNNTIMIKDLRQILDLKKSVSFDGSESASSSSSSDRMPYSDRTNRARIMGVLPRKTAPPIVSPTTIENLKNTSFANADPNSAVWDTWSSSDSERNLKNTSFANADPNSAVWDTWSSSDSERNATRSGQDPFVPTGEPLVDLYSFTHLRKLPEPQFKIVNRKAKPHKAALYDCKVDIGEHSYTTYPKDFTNVTAAKQHAAKLALDDLMPKYTKRKSLLISNNQDVLARIPLMVEKHYHGIWNWQLEADYADLYNEQLPLNWLQVVDTSSKVSVEPFLDKYVLRYCKPEDKGKTSFMGPVSEVSVPVNTVDFLEDGCLLAEITCVVSAKEVWCRQIGTLESEAYNHMITNFEQTYNENPQNPKPEVLNEGSYCAAYFDQNWYRVKVFEVNENDENCFFIDYGDVQLIRKSDIYQLRREFAKEKAQAFICRLAGLEELYEVSINSEHIQNLVGRTVHLEPDSIEDDAPIPVVLYDPESSITINQELIGNITIESATPVLNKAGVTQVYVCHAESNGDVYLHIQSPGFEKLETLLTDLETSIIERADNLPAKPITPQADPNRLYFGKYKEDDHWYRIKILEWAPNGLFAQIYFVDYGNCDIIKVADEKLYPLDELSDVIDRFPAQAVRVRMQMNRVPDDFVEKVYKLMPKDEAVLLKVIDEDVEDVEGRIPIAQFFKRIPPNNVLCSINESITFESEQEEIISKPERLQRLLSSTKDDSENKNVPSTGILKSPTLPKIGEYFDVKVPTAVNPWNFFVQPYECYNKLTKLMTSLQEAYRTTLYSPLQIDDVQPGNIYASKHKDGKWYRTSVIKVINPGSIAVFYCDFGYYNHLTLQQLIPLQPQFLELPYQAINAKLSGIKPKQSKWTMDDCKFFQKLVLRKSLVSILVSIEKDELYKCDKVLNLKLIDTSTETDVHINEVLIRKGIAVEDTPVAISNGNN